MGTNGGPILRGCFVVFVDLSQSTGAGWNNHNFFLSFNFISISFHTESDLASPFPHSVKGNQLIFQNCHEIIYGIVLSKFFFDFRNCCVRNESSVFVGRLLFDLGLLLGGARERARRGDVRRGPALLGAGHLAANISTGPPPPAVCTPHVFTPVKKALSEENALSNQQPRGQYLLLPFGIYRKCSKNVFFRNQNCQNFETFWPKKGISQN